MAFDFREFGSMVFGDEVMKENLPSEVYKSLKRSIDNGETLNPQIADTVADAMKDWAISKGATHFTHWFQPLNACTAGKHDSFINFKDGRIITHFSGKELIKGEPDASSFPSGGLRNTFEARGYTAWDCTSPAFVRSGTLYIPTAFCSYNGEALDTKTPLLRSMKAINDQALRFVRLFGNKTATGINVTVGAEQEYFLIDREKYEKRLDLKICGRTLFGARPPKGQEMDDHYLGRIRLRVLDFMKELDQELWRLGVTSKTEHNEVAPAQHELAPIFDYVNVACDHNQLTMEVMRETAKKKGLACLLHEKPFGGVNGSGKHNNWSVCTNDGINLLEPGKNPYENMQFLLMLCAIITAVDKHAGLLRMSAAVPGNDYRLGASEAPPAIMSIFLGEQLTNTLYKAATGDTAENTGLTEILTEIETLPTIITDSSDRNRTSPFAFTGNKFEFRSVGSSQSIAEANTVLNTIVAEALDEICERLESCDDFDKEAKLIISDTIKSHGRVIFNGNNYTDEWLEEAHKRGLLNLTNTVAAFEQLNSRDNIEVLSKYNVLTPVECASRYEIKLENYAKIITIEANTMLEMLSRQIIPAITQYAGECAQNYNLLKQVHIENKSIYTLAEKLSDCITLLSAEGSKLETFVARSGEMSDFKQRAVYCRDIIKTQMELIRTAADDAEAKMKYEEWPMPSYTDILHRV